MANSCSWCYTDVIFLLWFQIEVGSTNVRVGSTIFGAREYKNKPSTSTDATQTSTANPEQTAETLQNQDINHKS